MLQICSTPTQVFGRVWNKAGFLAGEPTEHPPHTTHTTQLGCMSINVPTQTARGKRRSPKSHRHAAELSNVNCCGMRHTHARASWCGRLGCVWHGSLKAHASLYVTHAALSTRALHTALAATKTSIYHCPAAAFCCLRPRCRDFMLPLDDIHARPVLGWRVRLQSKRHPMMVATALQ